MEYLAGPWIFAMARGDTRKMRTLEFSDISKRRLRISSQLEIRESSKAEIRGRFEMALPFEPRHEKAGINIFMLC